MQRPMIITEPLATARLYLPLNPNKDENHALRELLAAFSYADSAQPIRDISLFEGALGQLTAALVDARASGRYAAEQWRSAAAL